MEACWLFGAWVPFNWRLNRKTLLSYELSQREMKTQGRRSKRGEKEEVKRGRSLWWSGFRTVFMREMVAAFRKRQSELNSQNIQDEVSIIREGHDRHGIFYDRFWSHCRNNKRHWQRREVRSNGGGSQSIAGGWFSSQIRSNRVLTCYPYFQRCYFPIDGIGIWQRNQCKKKIHLLSKNTKNFA